MHLCKHSTSSSTNTLQMTPQFTWEWCSAVERRAQSTNDTRRWCQEMLERLTWRHLCLSFTYKCNFMFLRPRQASSLIQSLRKQKNVTDARCSDLPSGDYDYFFLVIWSAGSVRNSWTRNWISLNTGANFSHQSLLYFWSKKGQGSICVPITSPEKKIIIRLGGEKRPLLIHCSQISSFMKS